MWFLTTYSAMVLRNTISRCKKKIANSQRLNQRFVAPPVVDLQGLQLRCHGETAKL